MRLTLLLPALVALLVALSTVIDYAARPSYPVPPPGSVVLITGAKRGIGFSAAKALAAKGFYVFAGTHTKSDAEAIDKLKLANLDGIELDVLSEDHMIRAEAEIREFCRKNHRQFGGIVHNGIAFGHVLILILLWASVFT